MSLMSSLMQRVKQKQMDDEIAALRNNSQVFDRTGTLASQLAQQEDAIRQKYAPFVNAPAAPQNGKFFGLPNPVRNTGLPNPVQNTGLPVQNSPQPVQNTSSPVQNADLPALTQPLQQPDIRQNAPQVGLINRTMQRVATPRDQIRGGLAGIFQRLANAKVPMQNDIAQRLGGPRQQIDFNALKEKFRGKL